MAKFVVSIEGAPTGTWTKVKSLLGEPETWEYEKPNFTFDEDVTRLAAVLELEGVSLVTGPVEVEGEVEAGDVPRVWDEFFDQVDARLGLDTKDLILEEAEPEPEPEPEPSRWFAHVIFHDGEQTKTVVGISDAAKLKVMLEAIYGRPIRVVSLEVL